MNRSLPSHTSTCSQPCDKNDKRVLYYEYEVAKLATLAPESFGRLGVEGSYFIDQMAVSVVGGGRRIDGEEGGVDGTPLTDRLSDLSDNTGGHFEASATLQATALRSQRCEKESRGKG